MISKIKYVRKNEWTTQERIWGTTTQVIFREPAGARIRLKFGAGWLSFTSQNQTLDGITNKILHISRFSFLLARVQVRAINDEFVAYRIGFEGT